jgi:hypothetical protein
MFVAGLIVVSASSSVWAQEQEQKQGERQPVLDGSDLAKELHEREVKLQELPEAERTKLHAAYVKAFKDPEVLAALERRDAAIKEFQEARRAGMLRADPSVEPLLEQMATLARED